MLARARFPGSLHPVLILSHLRTPLFVRSHQRVSGLTDSGRGQREDANTEPEVSVQTKSRRTKGTGKKRRAETLPYQSMLAR